MRARTSKTGQSIDRMGLWIPRGEFIFRTCSFHIIFDIDRPDVEIQFYDNSIYQRASSAVRTRNVEDERSAMTRD